MREIKTARKIERTEEEGRENGRENGVEGKSTKKREMMSKR